MGKRYKIGGKVYFLDKELYQLAKQAGVTRDEIEQEYRFMSRITPGIKVVTYNHAMYSAYVKKSKGKNLWQ